MDVEDEVGLTGLSFLVSTFGFEVVGTGFGDIAFDGSSFGIPLESIWESSEDPDDCSDGILDGEWDTEAL